MRVLDDDGADVPEPADPAGLDHHELVEAILHAPLPPVPARVRTANALNIEYDSRF